MKKINQNPNNKIFKTNTIFILKNKITIGGKYKMKATGIVRRIDDLGRIVIPKEIRRTLRIRVGDPLEIYTNSEGEVVFKKYSPIGEISTYANMYSEILYKTTGSPIVITDKDHVVSVSGLPKKEILERRISPELENVMEKRLTVNYLKKSDLIIKPIEGVDKYAITVENILVSGDIVGSVFVVSPDKNTHSNETLLSVVGVAAKMLGKQLEE